MKNLFQILALALLAVFFVACGPGVEGEDAETGDQVEIQDTKAETVYVVDPSTSLVNWQGGKFTGDTHQGNLKVKSGEIKVAEGNIVGGTIILDMNSINVTDLEAGKGKENLEAHLKGTKEGQEEDFFYVTKYPTATFEIASAEAIEEEGVTHAITGNLTMRDSVKAVTFKANVDINDKAMTASSPQFKINRLDWGIKFMSTLANVSKDKAITDDFGLKIDLNATEASQSAQTDDAESTEEDTKEEIQ